MTPGVTPRYAAPLRAVDELEFGPRDGLLHIEAVKQVRLGGDAYQAAHFPGRIVYPGVFILETVRQSVIEALGERDGVLPELSAIRSLRFLGGLHKDERLCMAATVRPVEGDGSYLVDAVCRRPDESTVARLILEFAYQGEPDD